MLKCLVLLILAGCLGDQGSKNYIDFFRDTEAFNLAKAVDKEDLYKISELVKANQSLLKVTNSIDGSNVLGLSIHSERYRSFQKLIELGADPNFINPITSHSILMDAIKPFGSELEWREENKYAYILLNTGADPNYIIKEDYTNSKGHRISAGSALYKASRLNLDLVKSLISFGADPKVKIGSRNRTPLGNALKAGKFDIAEYYIDSIGIDFTEPLYTGKKDTLYIQDFIVNKFTKARLRGDEAELARLKDENKSIMSDNTRRWQLIEKLELSGVEFVNYDYSKY